jgi:hypothetical protein
MPHASIWKMMSRLQNFKLDNTSPEPLIYVQRRQSPVTRFLYQDYSSLMQFESYSQQKGESTFIRRNAKGNLSKIK